MNRSTLGTALCLGFLGCFSAPIPAQIVRSAAAVPQENRTVLKKSQSTESEGESELKRVIDATPEVEATRNTRPDDGDLEVLPVLDPFIRGDVDSNGILEMADAMRIVHCKFSGARCPECEDAADVNDDGSVDISDIMVALNYLYLGRERPALPFPDCGVDLTPSRLSCLVMTNCHVERDELFNRTPDVIKKNGPGRAWVATEHEDLVLTRLPGAIAFTTQVPGEGNNAKLSFVDWDGSNQSHLDVEAADPAWSPDGHRIAYQSRFDIWIVDRNGENKKNVTNDQGNTADFQPSWSPDGGKIVFSRGGNLHVWTIDQNGNSVATQRITTAARPIQDYQPTWSPDGSTIVFSRRDGSTGDSNLYLVRPDGSDLRQLTSGSQRDEHPSWSPDGRKIVYSRYDTGGEDSNLRVIALGGIFQFDMQLTSDPDVDDVDPCFSPDGAWVVFSREVGGGTQIFLVRLNGSNAHRLTSEDSRTGPTSLAAHWRW